MLELEIQFDLNHERDCARQVGNSDTCRFNDPLIILHCHRDAPFKDPAGSACLPRPRPNLNSSTVLEAGLLAIGKAEAPMTHVIKNAVRGNRAPGGVPASFGVAVIQVSGPQNQEGKQSQHPRFDEGCRSRQDRKPDSQAAGNLSNTSQVSKASSERHPRWNEAGRDRDIKDMPESDWENGQPEDDLGDPDAFRSGDVPEEGRLLQARQARKQYPSAGKQHTNFTVY
jgi:hypothetical protein